MKKRRLKFIWGASRVVRGRWYLGLFGLYDRVEGGHEDGLAISLRGLLIWCLGLGLAAYVAAATALFWLWQRNPYSILGYWDALGYPLRQKEITAKKGQAFIAQGTDAFRARRYAEAGTLLRLGIARYPHDLPARLLLAQYYFLANQRPLAAAVVEEGLTDLYPGRAYLEAVFKAAELGEDFDRVVQVGERYAPQLRARGSIRDYRWVVGRQFAALIAAGRNPEALELATNEEPGEAAREHRVLALLAAGRPDEALTFLDDWQRLPGADRYAAGRLRVRALREAKRFDEMNGAIAGLRALNPAEPGLAVYGVVQLAMGGREAAADAALQDYLFRFGGSLENLLVLADPLAEIGDLTRLKTCTAAAAERGYVLLRFQTLLVQVHVQRGEWAEAGRILAAMPPESGPARVAWRTWMQDLVDAGLVPGDSAQLALLEMLRSRPWPIQMFRVTADALMAAGRLEAARDVIALAARGFPRSARVQAQAGKVAAQLAAREAPAMVAAPASIRLPGERMFFEQLDQAIEARQWEEAGRMIREAYAARPAPNWVAAREPALRLAQVRVSHGGGDRAGMVTAARLFLNGDNERSQQALEAAQEFFRGGDKDSALVMTREVLLRTPNFPPARRLLAEWDPKPEPAKK